MFSNISENQFLSHFTGSFLSVDSHTAGEATRVILGYPSIPGKTIQEKRTYLKSKEDSLRLLLTREPRGNRETIATLVTEPVTPGAAFGLIYMDARRYPYLCGHGTIGAITTLVDLGIVKMQTDQGTIIVDTPSGPVNATVFSENGKVKKVAIKMVPSFVYATDQTLALRGLGNIQIDLVYSGGFFVMVEKDQIGLDLIPQNVPKLIQYGMDIISEANHQLQVQHPIQKYVNTIDVAEFYDPVAHSKNHGMGCVVYGESHMDRSPCGTGTCAKLALMHYKGQLAPGDTLINAGILGTTFESRIVEITHVGTFEAVVGEICGSAYITGYHRFVLESDDPFPTGFLV